MRLTHHSFADDGEYIFVIEDDDDPVTAILADVRPGMVLHVDGAYYTVTSVEGDTVTATPVDNSTP